MPGNIEKINKQKEFEPERPRGILDTLKRELEQEFEEVYGNIEPPEAREEFRKRWLAEEIKQATEIEDQNNSLEEQIEIYKKSKIDSVTGFERREGLFKEMDAKINKIVGAKKGETPDVVIHKIENEIRDFKDIDESVIMSDVSYLSLANKEGHEAGDELLAKISAAIKKNGIKAYRHGGDEITALIPGPQNQVENSVKSLEHEVRTIKDLSSLQKYNLKPNIDVGTARFSEAVEAFKSYLNEFTRHKDAKILGNINFIKELENIWLAIADKRSFIKKGLARVKLLMDRIDKKYYSDIVSSLRKGGYDISDSDLREIKNKNHKKDKNKTIWAYIKEKEEKILSEITGEDRIRAEIVYNIAKREFDKKYEAF